MLPAHEKYQKRGEEKLKTFLKINKFLYNVIQVLALSYVTELLFTMDLNKLLFFVKKGKR